MSGTTFEPTPSSAAALEQAKAQGKGYILDCFFHARDGETLFTWTNNQCAPSLLGYAIIPVEEYEALKLASGKGEVVMYGNRLVTGTGETDE